jgi:hypothetical protein
MILDAGAFVAVERGNREVIAFVKRERAAGRDVVTHGGVVGQIWRGGGWQAGVGRKTASQRGGRAAGCEGLGKRAGLLLARGGAGSVDAVDAAIVCLANDGDDIITSDPGDIRGLVQAAGVHVELIPV